MAATIIAAAVIVSLVATPMEGANLPGREGTYLPSGALATQFESTDGNLTVQGILDWGNVSCTTQDDQDSGSGDDAFGKGTKEDTAVPVPVTGSIPPNKSDLSAFGVYLEENDSGGKFMHLFWTRVQDPKGTTNMDFEFNQSDESANGKTPNRTDGDLLIEYKLSKGGTVPELWRYTWIDGSGTLTADKCVASSSLPCWGDKTNLTESGDAAGSINTSLIPAGESYGMGDLDPYTFGEASVDLTSIFDPNKCTSFGSAYLKSRSSDSFTSAIKDFIAPQTVDIKNCGAVIIVKNTVPSDERGDFHFSSNISTDSVVVSTFSLNGGDSETISNVLSGGPYMVTEANPDSLGWDLTSIDCGDGSNPEAIALATATFTVDTDDTVTCIFTNTKRGNINVLVETTPGGSTQDFHFTLSGPALTDLDFSASDSTGYNVMTDSSLGWLRPDSGYSIREYTEPAGWFATGNSCDDGSRVENIELSPGETATCTFTYVKMGTIIVRKETTPSGDPQSFDFTSTYGPDFSLTDFIPETAGPQNDSGYLLPGTYSVSESDLPGWELTSSTCDDGESTPGNINLQAGETVTCTFNNTKLFTIITLVCHADQLYASTVALGNGTPIQTLDLTAQDSTSFNLCTLTGARFEDMSIGNHPITVSISPLPR